MELPGQVSALELHERALRAQISIAPGPMFSAQQAFPNFVRLNAGHPWSPRLEQAIGKLADLVRRMG